DRAGLAKGLDHRGRTLEVEPEPPGSAVLRDRLERPLARPAGHRPEKAPPERICQVLAPVAPRVNALPWVVGHVVTGRPGGGHEVLRVLAQVGFPEDAGRADRIAWRR